MDSGTLMEVFSFLNYCQLARNCLVSKRFRDLIRTNRHRLALLYVDNIYMVYDNYVPSNCTAIKIVDKWLSPEEYNEWVIRNGYSKQVSLEDQRRFGLKRTNVFYANADFNLENWPVFQHFVRLLSDPFIYIRSMELAYQTDVLSLLSGAINQDHGRLQCKQLVYNLCANAQQFMSWKKDHVLCDQFKIIGFKFWLSNFDEMFLDFFMTGANCTSRIDVRNYNLSVVLVDFVKKFMDLKHCDEYQIVETIESNASFGAVDVLKRVYAEFIVKEEKNEDDHIIEQVFEFVNVEIGKKLQLTFIQRLQSYLDPYSSFKIFNL
ncbi:hypothetical protein Ddc_14508 [Ditylenchus destructor]|nr:hypothetical protein Ddc_14508 [Ditylenchus destructor]